MKTYSQFILNEKHTELKYSIFDWDDNILHMDTKIHLKHKVNGFFVDEPVSTSKYAKIRNLIGNGEWDIDYDKAYVDFRDYGEMGKNAFINDVKNSIDKKMYGPSWDSFINVLVEGNLFGIVTTRGHEPDTLRKGVEYIIYNYLNIEQQNKMLNNLIKFHYEFNEEFDYLVDDYLNNCYFIGIMSDYFKGKFDFESSKNVEKAKKIAINYIIREFDKYSDKIGADMTIGFSDDDPGYLNTAKKLFINNKELFDNTDFYVFDTSDPHIKGGKKLKIGDNEEL